MSNSVGFSQFFIDNSTREMGNSYTSMPSLTLLTAVQNAWDNRVPGRGEMNLDRKVVVPLEPASSFNDKPAFFCPPRVKLVAGMPLHAHAVVRQEGEEPHVEVYILPEDAKRYDYIETPAKTVGVVCYSAAALLENGGSRTGTCDWEIITLLCSADDQGEVMTPITMARQGIKVRPHPKKN